LDKIRVGIIFGGRSEERDISLLSARSIIEAIDKSKYEVLPVAISKSGKWLLPAQSEQLLIGPVPNWEPPCSEEAPSSQRELMNIEDSTLGTTRRVNVVFPVLHGPYGEDGTIQGLLELADIPYVGAGVLASALGMDKVLMKAVFRQRGLPVPDDQVVRRWQWQKDKDKIVGEIERNFPYPCFVKPANLGSSIGISKARSRPELVLAVDEAARYDRKILIEEAIEGREIECSVLGNDEPIASALGEIIPARDFYDYEAKYNDDRTQLIIPAAVPAEIAAEIRRLAIEAFLAIDGEGMARVDFLLDRRNFKIYVSEINTIPGFTQVSMYPKLWEVSGISYPDLIDRLIQLALERHQDKKRGEVQGDSK
jgi:D-alanine-D-alanine ligase